MGEEELVITQVPRAVKIELRVGGIEENRSKRNSAYNKKHTWPGARAGFAIRKLRRKLPWLWRQQDVQIISQ